MIKLKNKLFVIIFLLIVIGVGALSFAQLTRFYMNQETVNNEWSPELGSKFETDIVSTFFEKMWFVDLNGAVCRLFHQPYMNEIVRLNNGHLMQTVTPCEDPVLDYFADNTEYFAKYLEDRGTALLYVAPPDSNSKYDSQIPVGFEDYGNQNIDGLMERLNARGIDAVDFREKMHEDGIDHYDMMYKTDHHWTTEAGFYAYGVIEDYITEKTGCTVDERISEIDNYTVTTYKNWHLGSFGQRTGKYYAGVDDFDLIVPKFETSLVNDSGEKGSFQELVIDTTALEKRDYNSRYTYDSVLGNSLGHFTNENAANDVKVLVITDSFGKAVNPYLILGFKEVYYMYDQDVSGITPEYIESVDPDVVIMLYYTAPISVATRSFEFGEYENAIENYIGNK